MCKGLPDTGTSRTILHERLLKKAGLVCNPAGREPISTANGTSLRCKGNIPLEISVHGRVIQVNALVASNLHTKCLVSWRDLQLLGIIHEGFPGPAGAVANAVAATETVESIMEEFADVFDESVISPMEGDPMHVHLRRDEPTYKPTRVSVARRVPLHFAEEAEKTLKWFLDSGVIKAVSPTERTEWCSPGFFVPKPNGAVRLVVDYRDINKFIDRPVHPFPSPRDVVKGVRPQSKWFMKLDAVQGYYQLPLDEESSLLTTFLMPSGRFRFTRAPMGMSSSSDEFCFRTDRILAEVPDMLKIVDDALLQAPTYEELCRRFRLACEAARRGNLTLSRGKVVYGPEIEFAGYIISSDGVKPDPRRLAAVTEFPRPTDVSSLRGFLGLVNQLGFFVPDLAHMTEDLRQLLKKGNAWQWLDDHEQAFLRVKKELTSPLVVKAYDPRLKTELLTDASRTKGLGYALLQREEDGRLRLIQCSSRSLSPAETRYATIELECLAIQWAVEDARHFLLGCNFVVWTDHRPLEGLFKKPLSEVANTRLLRIRLKMTDYSMEVTWTPGKTHLIADALSRAPVFDPAEPGAEVNAVEASDPALQPLFQAAASDESYMRVIEALVSGKRVEALPPDHPARIFKSIWEDLSVHEDSLLVLDGQRIVVPPAARAEVLGALHLSHPGIVRSRELAKQCYYWPGMHNDIKNMVDGCELCQLTRPSQPADDLAAYPEPTEPMQMVSLDLCESSGKEYLVMCDRYSGMTWAALLRQENTAAVTRELSRWFNQYGYPQCILSDGGPQFRGEFKAWCETRHIKPEQSSPYHSPSNGLAEAAVKSTKKLLEKSSSFMEFEERLLEWRNVPTKGKLTSPSQRFFGRIQRTQLPRLADQVTRDEDETFVPRFRVGDRVRLQNPISKRWDCVGNVEEVRKSGRSFGVRRDEGGQLLIRNQRFLKHAPAQLQQAHGGAHAGNRNGDGGGDDRSIDPQPRRSKRLAARSPVGVIVASTWSPEPSEPSASPVSWSLPSISSESSSDSSSSSDASVEFIGYGRERQQGQPTGAGERGEHLQRPSRPGDSSAHGGLQHGHLARGGGHRHRRLGGPEAQEGSPPPEESERPPSRRAIRPCRVELAVLTSGIVRRWIPGWTDAAPTAGATANAVDGSVAAPGGAGPVANEAAQDRRRRGARRGAAGPTRAERRARQRGRSPPPGGPRTRGRWRRDPSGCLNDLLEDNPGVWTRQRWAPASGLDGLRQLGMSVPIRLRNRYAVLRPEELPECFREPEEESD